MKLLNGKTLLTAATTLGSVFVLAATVNTFSVNNNDFMNDEEIKFVKRFDSSVIRNVASAERELPSAQYLPVNEINASLINGKWEIVRILDEQDNEVYKKSEKVLAVEMEMIGTSRIRLDEDNNMIFDLSLLSEDNKRITLFRSFGKGFEIIEAKRIEEEVKVEEVAEVVAEQVVQQKETNVILNEENSETVLERALFPSKTSEILKGQRITGELAISEGAIESMSFTLEISEQEQINVAEAGIELQAGGSFMIEIDGEQVSGLLTNNGKEGVRVRFVSGKLQGALLNFVTVEEMERIQEKEEETLREREEALVEQEQKVEEAQKDVSNERLEQAELDAEELVSEEEAMIQAEEEGFAF